MCGYMELCKHQMFSVYQVYIFGGFKIFLIKLWQLPISPSISPTLYSPNSMSTPWIGQTLLQEKHFYKTPWKTDELPNPPNNSLSQYILTYQAIWISQGCLSAELWKVPSTWPSVGLELPGAAPCSPLGSSLPPLSHQQAFNGERPWELLCGPSWKWFALT